jgi:cytoskeletal protein CcmA (bactofilin family)
MSRACSSVIGKTMFLRRKKQLDEREPLVWVDPDMSSEPQAPPGIPSLHALGSREAARAGTEPAASATAIGAGMTITGDVQAQGRLQLAGRIEGKVRVPVVEIEQPGVIVGEIHAERVTVSGIVTGRIEASQIRLTAAAQVVADLVCQELQIDRGASFEGHCRRPG